MPTQAQWQINALTFGFRNNCFLKQHCRYISPGNAYLYMHQEQLVAIVFTTCMIRTYVASLAKTKEKN